MGMMIPLGSVLGWIFAVLGTLVMGFCYAALMIEADIEDNEAKRFAFVFIVALIALVAGMILIAKYWGGGA